jgi:hypothetical protein
MFPDVSIGEARIFSWASCALLGEGIETAAVGTGKIHNDVPGVA